MRKYPILLLFLLLSTTLLAQTQQGNPTFVGLRGHAGFLWIHSKTLAAIGQPYPWGVEVDLGKQFISQKAWDGCNCYPRAGVSLTYWNFDTPVLGHGLTAVAYMEPIYLTQHRFNLSLRWGMGLSYISQPFDSVTNPLNQAYSTRIAFPLAVNLGMYYRLNSRLTLRAAANYNHISNGGIKLPNKGLNYPSASLGVDAFLEPVNFEERTKNIDKKRPDKRNRVYIGHYSALSQLDPAVPRQYYVAGFWTKYSRNVGKRSSLTVGLEFTNDLARRNESERWGFNRDHKQLAATLGHEFWLGKVVFSQELGIYLYDKLDLTDPVYQRYAVIYHFHPKIFGGISLKAHRHVADFLDLRVGVTL